MAARETIDSQATETKEDGKESIGAETVELLRSRLSPLIKKPYYADHLDVSTESLTRWLDSADQCVLLAEARLRASIATRKKTSLLQTGRTYSPPYALKNNFGHGICGADRDGSPIAYQLFGLTDMMGIVQACTNDEMLAFWSACFQGIVDAIKRVNEEQNKAVHDALLIVEMQGCSVNNFRWSVLCAWAKALQLFQEVCPSLFKEILLIHPPFALPVIHRFLAPRLSLSTRKRLTVIGDGNLLRHLLIRIEKYMIPAYLGGYKCDMDNNPYCHRQLKWPQKVPGWLYHTDPRLAADVISIVVPPGDLSMEEIQVPVSGSRITWTVYEVSHPVQLQLLPPSATGADTVKHRPLVNIRVDNDGDRKAGTVLAGAAGSYTLALDNSKDMIHTVRAKIKVYIQTPDDYLSGFEKQVPLGDMINFSAPVSPEERKRRHENLLACQGFQARKLLNKFY